MSTSASAPRCTIVPPYLLEAIAASGDGHTAHCAERTLVRDGEHRARRAGRAPALPSASSPAVPAPGDPSGPQRLVSDAGHGQTLPGHTVRTEGAPATGDPAADEAYDGLGDTWALFETVYGRNSLDGRGLALLASVHFGTDYDNAFWDGTRMVFGDGDGTIFNRFTISLDVIGHELTHGVTELTAGLTYQGQSGALNESLSDVFGSLVRQRALGQDAAEADWLIGKGLFTDQVKGVALRSMKAPGTAYDDPRLGKDPQPAHLRDYVHTTDDNGGVHINSGIPNHAFYLAAIAVGGPAWEPAGQVWFDALTGAGIAADCDFATFARLTVAAAQKRYAADAPVVGAVRDAWIAVGVLADAPADPSPAPADPRPAPAPVPGPAQVRVRRTGGLAGMRQERTVALAELPEADAGAWRDLLEPDRLTALASGGAVLPDAFTYHVACPPDGAEVALHEHGIPGPVRELLQRTLER